MSNRGRGRGGGASANSDRSASSSNASSRSSSMTNLSVTSSIATTSVLDADQIMKQLNSKAKAVVGGPAGPGATKTAPKSYKPNLLAAKKEKSSGDVASTVGPSSGAASSSFSPGNKRRDPNFQQRPNSARGASNNANNRGRNPNENCVQLQGIFQANAQSFHSSTSTGRGSSGKRDGSSSSSLIHSAKRLGTSKMNLIGSVDGLKYEIDDEYQPRQIPIAEKKSVFDIKQEPDFINKPKEGPVLKNEHLESFIRLFSEQKLDTTQQQPIVKDEPMEVTDLPKSPSVKTDTSQLILMQFPDVLPCVRPSSSTEKPELASLSDLPDGFLGKLQIYRSGRCRLKLNDQTYLDVDIGQSASFLQNVMATEMASTTSNPQGPNNDMNKLVCLGDIKHKLVVSLDVDHVLKDTRQ